MLTIRVRSGSSPRHRPAALTTDRQRYFPYRIINVRPLVVPAHQGDDLRAVGCTQPLHDFLDVRFHRAFAHLELEGDGLVGHSGRQALEDLFLPRGQPRRGAMLPGRDNMVAVGRRLLRDGGAYTPPGNKAEG